MFHSWGQLGHEWIFATLFAIVARIPIGAWTRSRRKRYCREITIWAVARGWICRDDSDGRTRETLLPHLGKHRVRLQVDGIYVGRRFTFVYADALLWTHPIPTWIEKTMVIVHLRSTYPAADVKSRSMFRRSAVGTIGHAEFDKKFRVRTDHPGGPGTVVSIVLAEAHVAGDVPLWSLRDRELMCHTKHRPRLHDLETVLERAVRAASLLGD